eukprot:283429-Pleurochrysis_carterae.AAC.1
MALHGGAPKPSAHALTPLCAPGSAHNVDGLDMPLGRRLRAAFIDDPVPAHLLRKCAGLQGEVPLQRLPFGGPSRLAAFSTRVRAGLRVALPSPYFTAFPFYTRRGTSSASVRPFCSCGLTATSLADLSLRPCGGR